MPVPIAARDLGAVAGEDRRFGPRRVVLRQLGDRLEQARAEPVVEELRRSARVFGEQRGARRVAIVDGADGGGLNEFGRAHQDPRVAGRSETRSAVGRGRVCSRGVAGTRTHLTPGSPRMPAMGKFPDVRRGLTRRQLLKGSTAAIGLGLASVVSASGVPGEAVGSQEAGAEARAQRSGRQALESCFRTRPGRRDELLGHLVRALPCRDAVARADGAAPRARRGQRCRDQLPGDRCPRSGAFSTCSR